MRQAARKFDSPLWVPGALALVQSVRLARIARMPQAGVVDYIPDDAFYYLQLARNFARTGRWTFDGVEPASGFHLLWGYLLAGFYRVLPEASLRQVFVAGAAVELVCLIVAAWLLTLTGRRLFGPAADWGVAAVLFATVSLSIGLALMESSLVLLFSAALLYLLCRAESSPSKAAVAAAFLLGLGGMAARSDFGLLPAALLVAQLALLRVRPRARAGVVQAGAAMGGALLGALLLALHTHWISSNWIQSSARTKLWWSQLQGFSLKPVADLLGQFSYVALTAYYAPQRTQHLAHLLSHVLQLMVVAGILWAIRRLDRDRTILTVGLLLTVAAYALFYRQNSAAIQSWYIGPFEAPIALLTGAAVSAFASFRRWPVIVAAVCFCIAGIAVSFKPMYPFQRTYYQAGLYLHQHPELGPVAGWNCGVMGYFGQPVTNLDGLVNDRTLPYQQAGTLARYIGQRGIRTIIDSPMMLEGRMAQRSGIADGKLASCLVVQGKFSGNANSFTEDGRLLIYHVQPDCPALR